MTATATAPLTHSATVAAERIGTSRRWLVAQASAGNIPCVRFSRNAIRFTDEQITQIIRAHTLNPEALTPHPWGQTPASERRTRGRRAG